MKYRVDWKSETEEDLARIWLASKIPTQVAAAAKRLSRLLELHGDIAGESREDNHRIAFDRPLLIRYRIEPSTMTISIYEVRVML